MTTVPWSTVFLGQQKLGITPLANVRLPAGKHLLRLMIEDRRAVERAVTIAGGRVSKLRFDLR